MSDKSIRFRVIDVLEESSGFDLQDADDGAEFVELGLDSLFLTQASLDITREFGVEVTFRQMSESETTIGALCAYLAANGVSEPDASAAAPAAPAAAPEQAPVAAPQAQAAAMPDLGSMLQGVSGGGAEDLIRAQLLLMQQQLRVLTGQGVDNLSSPAAVTAQPASPAPAPSAPQQADAPPAQQSEQDKPAESLKGGRGAKITRSAGTELSPRQSSFIAGLVDRYIAQTPASKAYAQKHRAHLADPRTVSGFNSLYKEMIYPLVTNRSQGSRIWDVDGNEYIDHVCGFGPILFGHSPDFIVSAVQQQVAQGVETGPQSELAGDVAELVCELTGLERCAFASTGSEAVLGAIRLARTVTGKNKVVVFDGAYHGISDEAIYRKGRDGKGLPASPGIPRESTANLVVLPWNDMDALNTVEAMADDLAAILVEPVQSREPETQPRELLHRMREICDSTGAALIIDEMITGFRMHPGGAQAIFDVRADLATYGKIVGGGYPLGIIAGGNRFMDALDGGYWSYGDDSMPTVGVTYFAGTFVRHPVALAAAKAVLVKLRDSGPALQQDLSGKTTTLTDELREFLSAVSAKIQVHHCSSWFEVTAPREESFMPLFFALMRLKGFHVQDGRPFFLTTAHTDADLAAFVAAFRESISEMILNDMLDGDKLAAHRESKRGDNAPPVEGARLGRDEDGNPGWYVTDPERAGKYLRVGDLK